MTRTFVIGLLFALTLAPGTSASGSSTPLLYVANSANNSITAYPLFAYGNAEPVLTVRGPHTGLCSPSSVAVSGNGEIYALGDCMALINVYPAGANGDVAPIRRFGCGPIGIYPGGVIAVSRSGFTYLTVAPDAPDFGIDFFDSDDRGCVTKDRYIGDLFPSPTDRTKLGDPAGIAVDDDGTIYVVNTAVDYGYRSITEYAPGAYGNAAPIRDIVGPHTGFEEFPNFLALDKYENIYVTQNGNVSSVMEYGRYANGDVYPLRVIQGPHTLLGVAAGIAIAPDGRIYVADYANNDILIYAAGAYGDMPPLQRIAGSRTGLGGVYGITIAPPPYFKR